MISALGPFTHHLDRRSGSRTLQPKTPPERGLVGAPRFELGTSSPFRRLLGGRLRLSGIDAYAGELVLTLALLAALRADAWAQ